MSHAFRFLLTLSIAALSAGGLTLAHGTGPYLAQATSDEHDHDDDHAHDEDTQGTRLLVASADSAELVVLDLGTGREIARFTTPGVGRVYQLPDPRYAFVLHRDEHRVTVIHSGLSAVDHGGHMDLVEGSPYVLQTLNVGRQPTHFFARGHDVGIFNDQDGTIAWLDTRLLGISLDYTEIVTARPDQGSLSIVDGYVLSGHLRLARVDVYDQGGTLLETFEGCPELHGQAVSGATTVFGCSDGVLLVEVHADGTFSSHKIDAPRGAAEGARVGTLVSDPGSDVVIGSFGDALAIIDVGSRTMTMLGLGAAPLALRFAERGDVLVALTADGALHRLEVATGHVRSIDVVPAALPGMPRASLAVLGEFAYVGDPDHDRVVEVHIDDMDVERRFSLSITPGGVAVMAIPGAVTH